MSALKNPFHRSSSGTSDVQSSTSQPSAQTPVQPSGYTGAFPQGASPFPPQQMSYPGAVPPRTGQMPVQPAGYTGMPQAGQMPLQQTGYVGGDTKQTNQLPVQQTGYTGMSQAGQMPPQQAGYPGGVTQRTNRMPVQQTGYTGMSQAGQLPPQQTGYPGGVTQRTNQIPVQQTGYTGMSQGSSQIPPQPTGYTGMPQGAGQIPVQSTNYTGTVPQGYAQMPPFQTGYAGPVSQGTGQIPQTDTGAQNAGQAPSPQNGAANPPKDEKKEFSFKPSFHPVQEIRKKVNLSPLHLGIIAAALLLTGWYLFINYAPQNATTAIVQAGRYGTYYTGDALIVRNEVPYDADSVTSINYKAEEGTEINNGTRICEVFSSGFSTRELTTLQEYRDQIRDYQKAKLAEETTYDARLERVESEVMTQALEVRSLLAGTRGNLNNMQNTLDAAIEARQHYLREKYNDDQRLARLLSDELAQQQRIDSWTKVYYGTKTSLVSFYTDGFESVLTPQNCLDYTPAEVRSMIQGNLPQSATGPVKSKTTIYRTITNDEWYVLMLSHDTSWNPVENAVYDLELNQFENTDVKATVVSFAHSGGELLVRLRVEGNVESVLYMRTGTARIGDNVSTMMVPSRALYRQYDMDGVVVIDGDNSIFVPVQIVHRDGNDVYINSLQQGLLFEGQTVMLF